MEEITALPSELIATPIKMALPIKIKEGISIINENPLGVLEKLGKYEFIYDYQVPNFSWQNLLKPTQSIGFTLPSTIKEVASNANMIAPNTIWSGQSFPQPVKVNSEPQVGTFSKGNIVNVLRFDGNNAIIQNPNYIQPDPNAPKVGFFSGLDLKNQKEFIIPKSYLRKVDDNLSVTVSTGILYGANMEQPVYNIPPYKPTPPFNPIEVKPTPYVEPKPYLVIEEFKLKNYYNDWRTGEPLFHELPIIKGSVVFFPIQAPKDQKDQYDLAFQQGKFKELPIVSVVSLVDKQMGKCNPSLSQMQQEDYNPCRTVKKGEVLRGYIANGVFTNTNQDVIKPQLSMGEYELIQTNSGSGNNKNNGVVLPAEDNNKNLLMIVGAFLVGYLLFNKDTPTT